MAKRKSDLPLSPISHNGSQRESRSTTRKARELYSFHEKENTPLESVDKRRAKFVVNSANRAILRPPSSSKQPALGSSGKVVEDNHSAEATPICEGRCVETSRSPDEPSLAADLALRDQSCLKEQVISPAVVNEENGPLRETIEKFVSSEPSSRTGNQLPVQGKSSVGVKTEAAENGEGSGAAAELTLKNVQESIRRFHAGQAAGLDSRDAEVAQEQTLLQEAYDKLYKKYQRQKTKQLRGIDDLFDEQSRRVQAYSTASDALIENLKKEIIHLSGQLQETGIQEIISRSMLLEEDYIECQNDLVMERSRNLELRQELKEAHSYIMELKSTRNTENQNCNNNPSCSHPASDSLETSQEACPPSTTSKHSIEATHDRPEEEETVIPQSDEGALANRGRTDESKLLLELVENLTQLTAVVDGSSPQKIIFTHNESGFSFKLERNKLSEEIGGQDALLYQLIVPGTLLHLAPTWMQSEILFDMVQAHVFFQRILAVASGYQLK